MENNKQLYEKIGNEYKEVFPLNFIENIVDKVSGKTLAEIIASYNNIYVPYEGTAEATRNAIPVLLRRRGLWISYNVEDKSITEKYIGTTQDVTSNWGNNDNWEKIPDVSLVQVEAGKLPDGIITPSKLSPALQQLINEHKTIYNLPDDEDLEEVNGVIRFKDREYNPLLDNSKGYKILRRNWIGGKNVLTQDMINNVNTIYEIRYDFDLNGEEVTIPEGCILEFNGGSLDNGTLLGNNTYINADKALIFKENLNLSYIKRNNNYIWTFNNLINDIIANEEDKVIINYKNINKQWLLTYSNSFNKINNGDTEYIYNIFGLAKKTNNNKWKSDNIYLSWFGFTSNGLQRAIDFAYSSGIKNIHIEKGCEVNKTIILRQGIKLFGYNKETSILKIKSLIGLFSLSQHNITLKDFGLNTIINDSSDYSIVNFESHWFNIDNLYIQGYYKKGAILYSSALYIKTNNTIFSTNYIPNNDNEEYPSCISALESIYDLAYYGVNIGDIYNCSFIGKCPLHISGGEITINHCDFESRGFGKNDCIIALQEDKLSKVRVLIKDCYFEVYPENYNINPSVIKNFGYGTNVSIVDCSVYLQSYETKQKSSLYNLNDYYCDSLYINNNNLNRINNILCNIRYSRNSNYYIKNNFIGISEKYIQLYNRDFDKEEISRNSISYDVDMLDYGISNYDDFNIRYNLNIGKTCITSTTTKLSTSKILNLGLGNFIDLNKNQIDYVCDTRLLSGTIFYLKNGTINCNISSILKGGRCTIENNGYYENFIPTIIKSNDINLICVPIIKNGTITNVYTNGITTTKDIILTVEGKGNGANLKAVKNENNQITHIEILNGGSNYDDCYFIEDNNFYPLMSKSGNGYSLRTVYTTTSNNSPNKYLNLNIKTNTPCKVKSGYMSNIISINGLYEKVILKDNEFAVLFINDKKAILISVYKNNLIKGTTIQRPVLTNIDKGFKYFDTVLNKNIIWDGVKWIDSNNNPIDSLKQGTTQQRPTDVKAGFYYFDTTLNKPIWKKDDTTNVWVDATGAEV